MNRSRRRVVITGIGVITPLGNSKDALWQGLTEPRSGVGPLTSAPPGPLPADSAGESRDFRGRIDDFGPLERDQKKAIRKNLKVMCRECQMGVAAAQLALADAGLSFGSLDPERSGISFGSDLMLSPPEDFVEPILQCLDEERRFAFSRWALQGMPHLEPLWLLKYLPNMPASHVAIFNQLCGPNNSVTLREASSNVAIGEGFEIVASDRADVMLCGSTGTRIYPMWMMRICSQEEVAPAGPEPSRLSRPFDRHRTGMVLGEGAGALVLEAHSRAEARGATIYGEVLSQASSAVAGPDRTAQPAEALRNVLEKALRRARLDPDQIGHVNAHGLSTRQTDRHEAWAIHQVFGQRSRPVPVVAPKSHFGNLGAGSGAVELAASLLALSAGHLFPVLNYETPDPDCPVAAVTDQATAAGSGFVSLSVTPQAQAGAVLVRQV